MTQEEREPLPFDWEALVPLLLHPTQVEIIESIRMIGEPLSATDLRKVFDGRVLSQTISYHLGVLVEVGVVAQVSQRKVRGATEKFYFLAGSRASNSEDEPAASAAADSTTRLTTALLASAAP